MLNYLLKLCKSDSINKNESENKNSVVIRDLERKYSSALWLLHRVFTHLGNDIIEGKNGIVNIKNYDDKINAAVQLQNIGNKIIYQCHNFTPVDNPNDILNIAKQGKEIIVYANKEEIFKIASKNNNDAFIKISELLKDKPKTFEAIKFFINQQTNIDFFISRHNDRYYNLLKLENFNRYIPDASVFLGEFCLKNIMYLHNWGSQYKEINNYHIDDFNENIARFKNLISNYKSIINYVDFMILILHEFSNNKGLNSFDEDLEQDYNFYTNLTQIILNASYENI